MIILHMMTEKLAGIDMIGWQFIDDIPTYDTVYARADWFDAEKVFDGPDTYAVFTSASTVRGFVNSIRYLDLNSINAVCIGHMTAAEAEKYGMKVSIAKEATLDALVDLLEELGGNDE